MKNLKKTLVWGLLAVLLLNGTPASAQMKTVINLTPVTSTVTDYQSEPQVLAPTNATINNLKESTEKSETVNLEVITPTKILPQDTLDLNDLKPIKPASPSGLRSLVAGPVLDVPYTGSSFYKGSDIIFRWYDVAGAAKYEIWIDNNSGFGSPEIGFYNGQSPNWVNNGIVSTRQFTLTSAMQNQLPQNIYYWQVRALDSSNNPISNWSSPLRNFTLNDQPTPPAPPTLISPQGEVNAGQDITFQWNPSTGAGRYRLKIATDLAMSNPIASPFEPPNGVTSYTVSKSYFTAGQTYYWQVGAIAPGDTGGWGAYGPSTPWSIFIKPAQQQLNLISPSSNGTVNTKEITFEWSNVGAQKYELYVDNNAGLGSPEISKANFTQLENLTQTQFSISDTWLDENTYSWKVVAIMSGGSTIESSVGSFQYSPPKSAEPVWTHLYRLYNATEKDHFYTTNPAHRDQAVTNGYRYERIEGFVSDRPFVGSNRVALFHLYNPTAKDHFYTADGDTKDQKIATGGYKYQGITGFIYNNNTASDTVPLYYVKNTTNTDNFYTISQFERDYSINKYGFTDQGITGYLKYISPTNLEQPTVHTRPQANFGGADLGSGAYRGLNSADLSMEGRGPSLSFAHYYNSYNENLLPMGKGWSHNLNSRIIEEKRNGINYVYIFWGDGSVSEFEKTGSVYKDNSGNHDTLTLIDDGVNYGYDLSRKDQSKLTYRKIGNQIASKILLMSLQDWQGNALNFNYEASEGRLIDVSDGFNRKLVFTHNSKGQLTGVSENVGGTTKRSIAFTYNADGLLGTYKDPKNNVTTYNYFSAADYKKDLLKNISYPKGNIVEIDYDAAKKVNSMALSAQNPTNITYSYDPATQITTTTITDPKGVIFQTQHDSLMRAIGQRNGNTAQQPWATVERTDSANPFLPTKVTDKNGNQTQFQYDAMGNLTKITNAAGKVALFTYNSANNLLTATDFHAPASPPTPTTFIYDTAGKRLTQIKNPKNETITINYSAANLVASITDNLVHTASFEYDTYGNLKKITDPGNHITQFVNDYAGRLTDITDANNIKTSYTYDTNDNLLDISYFSKTAQKIFNVVMAYDANGNLDDISWINAVTAVTDYIYDTYDRLVSAKNPLNKTYSYTYDTNNLVKTQTSPNGHMTTFQYDSFNRLNKIIYPDTSYNIDVLARDGNGSITSLKGKNGTVAFAYNNLNQLTSYTDPYNKTVQYAYDDAGRQKTLTYPGNLKVEYSYDTAGRLEKVQAIWNGAPQNGATQYVYDTGGRLTQIQRPNGTKALFGYDNSSNLTSLIEQKSTGQKIAEYSYTPDPVGNYTSITAATEPVTAPLTAQTTTYTNNAGNQLLIAGPNTYTYDNNGNRKTVVTSGATTTYDWDYENMLTKVTTPGQTTEYKYDAMGNRVAKIAGGTTTKYVLDINTSLPNVLAETDANGNITAYYIYGLGLAERVDAGGNKLYYHFNHRGDTVALTDQQQNITDTYAYDEYGRQLAATGTTANPFTYVGLMGVMYEGDNIYHMRARYYDASVGRFLSEDPLGYGGGDWNIYAYVRGNPVMGVDPGGEFIFLIPEIVYVGMLMAGAGAGGGYAAWHLGEQIGYMSEGDQAAAAASSDKVFTGLMVAETFSAAMIETTSMKSLSPTQQKNTSGVHGNSKDYKGKTYGYQLKEQNPANKTIPSNVAKYGITNTPYTRYRSSELMSKEVNMQIMWPPMSRRTIHTWENQSILNFTDKYGLRPRLNLNNH